MRIVYICNTDGALSVFRGPLIKSLVGDGHEVFTVSDKSTYFQSLEEMGAIPRRVQIDRHGSDVLSNIRLFLNLFREIRRIKPDVVHNFTHKPAIFGTVAARLAGVKKTYITITGLGTVFVCNDKRSRLIRGAMLIAYAVVTRLSSKTFFQNPDDQNLFISNNVTPSHKALLSNGSGIDLTEISLPAEEDVRMYKRTLEKQLGFPIGQKKVVVFPARGVREKGFYEYYEAASMAEARSPGQFIFLHLGLIDGSVKKSLTGDDIEEHAKKSGVLYLGFKSNIIDYLIASDIVCLPSYREGTPRSLIEALALGKAIVTTDAPGCRETIEPGMNGYYCVPRDVESLVQALTKVDDGLIERSRGFSRKLCEDKYNVDQLIRLTKKEYYHEGS